MDDQAPSAKLQEQRTPSPADWLVLAAAAGVLVWFRLHAFPAPLESDECNYAYFAERLLAGNRLYLDVWDHQPPGIFAFLTLPTTLFGSAPGVYRAAALAACLITLLLLFDFARRQLGRAAAWTASGLYALASSDPGTAGEGCNREIYMNLLAVAAVWVLSRTLAGRRVYPSAPADASTGARRYLTSGVFLAGTLLGLASVFKTVVAVQWLLLALAVVGIRRFTQGSGTLHLSRRADLGKALLAFAAGPAILWVAIWTYFAATGRSTEFIDAVFTYNLAYGKTDQPLVSKLVAFFAKEKVFSPAIALWLVGAAGLAALPWRKNFLAALLVSPLATGSYLAVCLPGQFWPHYYHLMVPAMVLSAGSLVQRLTDYRRPLGALGGSVVLIGLLATQVPGYLLVEPDRIAWDRYKDRMAWVRDQAGKVAAVTDPQDSIYVWSADAGFYYYSGRRCASRFTMFGALVADHPTTAARRSLLIEDLTRAKPRLILIPAVAQRPFPELIRFFQEHRYISAGRDSRGMEILCDLERPIPAIDWQYEQPSL